MAIRYEKMLNITNHREKQMNATVSYHITPIRTAIIKREAVATETIRALGVQSTVAMMFRLKKKHG